METNERETYRGRRKKHVHFHNSVKTKITRSVLINDCLYFYTFLSTVSKMCQLMSKFIKNVIDCQYFSKFFDTMKINQYFSEFISNISILPVKLMFKFITTKW